MNNLLFILTPFLLAIVHALPWHNWQALPLLLELKNLLLLEFKDVEIEEEKVEKEWIEEEEDDDDEGNVIKLWYLSASFAYCKPQALHNINLSGGGDLLHLGVWVVPHSWHTLWYIGTFGRFKNDYFMLI